VKEESPCGWGHSNWSRELSLVPELLPSELFMRKTLKIMELDKIISKAKIITI
jgi:hypothetical protein